MSETFALTTILLLGLGFGFLATVCIKSATAHIKKIQAILKNDKLFKAKQAEVAQMKASGGYHEWVKIVDAEGELLVCKKTGWCPSLEGFVSVEKVKTYLDKVQAEIEHREYRDARVLALSVKMNLSLADTEKFVEEVFSIKKDFYVNRIEKLRKELLDKALAVEDESKTN